MRLVVHEAAYAEAIEGANYLDEERPGLGAVFALSVEAALERIANAPRRYAQLESVRLDGDIRRLLIRQFSYVVIYEVLEDHIEVLAVTHASREPGYWARRRGM